ncbi:hypothetical protein [Streptomyces cadmiisoli]|uniref:hypothetical protein n=1 Tax=Streptomyces cadmiisoli TaxID=2184053 RepID=UPI0018EF896B|nr:hypothetical protein [Streptomyces cadmiisoli]
MAAQLADEEIDALEPTFLGPTWLREQDRIWKLPERTLGWQIARWCAEFLKAEDGGPDASTREQLRFVLWLYAVDETGRFIYHKAVLQRLWGQGPALDLNLVCQSPSSSLGTFPRRSSALPAAIVA